MACPPSGGYTWWRIRACIIIYNYIVFFYIIWRYSRSSFSFFFAIIRLHPRRRRRRKTDRLIEVKIGETWRRKEHAQDSLRWKRCISELSACGVKLFAQRNETETKQFWNCFCFSYISLCGQVWLHCKLEVDDISFGDEFDCMTEAQIHCTCAVVSERKFKVGSARVWSEFLVVPSTFLALQIH